MEICDVVKEKTSNARRAATHLLAFLGGRSKEQCLMAVFLLDALATNCGYPMHVAITKKAFLNGLVYRFPPSSSAEGSLDETHRAILRLIEKLAIGLGRRSKHAADFGNIKCMHALLKGQHFAFPGHIPSEEVEALLSGESTPNSLWERADLEREERIIQETRLEDLLQRATPGALREANELMRTMTGHDRPLNDDDDDGTAAVARGLEAIGEQCTLLEDLLWNVSAESSTSTCETIRQLAGDVEGALSKLARVAADEQGSVAADAARLSERIRDVLPFAMAGKRPAGVLDNFSLISLAEEEGEGAPCCPEVSATFAALGSPLLVQLISSGGTAKGRPRRTIVLVVNCSTDAITGASIALLAPSEGTKADASQMELSFSQIDGEAAVSAALPAAPAGAHSGHPAGRLHIDGVLYIAGMLHIESVHATYTGSDGQVHMCTLVRQP